MSGILARLLVATSVLGLSAGAAMADYTLNILHINDQHSRIEPINKYDSTCSAEETAKNECFGGIARVKAKIDERRAALSKDGGNVIVLDAGDEFQGSLFYTTYKGDDTAEFMNQMGFDAMALGNHEFDDKPESLAKFLEKVKFPVISSNTEAAPDSPIAGKFKPYLIKEIGGQKIGIISALTTDTAEISSPGPSVKFANEAETLRKVVDTLKGEGVNKIIALNHDGYLRDKELAAQVDGIDVIVGGHSHTLLSNTDPEAIGPYPTLVKSPSGRDVPIVQAKSYSKYLGELKVTFDDEGNVIKSEGAPILLDSTVTPDPAFVARIKELAQPIEELKSRKVGESTGVIEAAREVCRARECSMGDLVADAMLDRVKGQGVTIAIINGGGLRASIDAGDVTMGEVLTVLPFQNTLATFQLRGSDVVAALENGVSQIDQGAGRFPQVAGLKYTLDVSKPAGSRISDIAVMQGDSFRPLDPGATYGVVSNNYMRAGGDGYKIFSTNAVNAYDYGPGLELVLADYLGQHVPYKPYTDGRITMAAAAPVVDPMPAPPVTQKAPEPAKPAAQSAANHHPDSYTIKRGDNFWEIAEEIYGKGIEWKKLAGANPEMKPMKLPIGAQMKVPGL
ncbi:LysM peptidoglycan-binding domain-containing protein [Phyllobacterium sp. SYP-B3895]|uniref:bifunctional metallophosphatase/5'-nucleotidase n=1 Tax=Phyllobacterium sp. SYP-B3895 TaxID=2663240 RepID=UPI00129A0356|nr:bifunctional metallophosphatase/5'-nucleotidase [Phyllobacterium sp. SYP-B3895]MRG56478.1 LysM peptidoglycan-binding domain-containing protein [Phyllobacterium sp. SYP-B3895]